MKILILSSTNDIKTGYGNMVHYFCNSLVDSGVSVTLLLPRDTPVKKELKYQVEYVLPEYIYNFKTPKIIDYLMFKYKTDADLVHSFIEFPYALLAYKIAKTNNKPYILELNGTFAVRPLYLWPEKYFVHHVYNNANFLIAISSFTKENVLGRGISNLNFTVIHPGVDCKRFLFSKDKINNFNDLYPDKKIILTVGALKPRKGQDVVIKALSLLKLKRNDFHYLIVGEGEFRTELELLIKKKRMESCVTLCGEVADNDLISYFQSCYLYAHTPRMFNWNFEGFGIVYIEAGACGKPVVASDSGGVKDAVIDGQTGIIVKEDNPNETAWAIEKLLDNPSLANTLGSNGFTYAEQHDWSVIIKQYIDIYKNILR